MCFKHVSQLLKLQKKGRGCLKLTGEQVGIGLRRENIQVPEWKQLKPWILICWIQIKRSKPNIQFWGSRALSKRFGSFISLYLAYQRKAFVLSHFTRQNTFFCFVFVKKKTLKINAPNSFFQNESNFFYIISDCFNKFLTTWSWTSC